MLVVTFKKFLYAKRVLVLTMCIAKLKRVELSLRLICLNVLYD